MRIVPAQEVRSTLGQLASNRFLYKPWYSPDKDGQGFFFQKKGGQIDNKTQGKGT